MRFKISSDTICRSLIILFCAFAFSGDASARVISYLVSIGNTGGGEVTGYQCRSNEICQIKVLASPGNVVTAQVQFVDQDAVLAFSAASQNLYSHGGRDTDNQNVAMKLQGTGCAQQVVSLFKNKSGIDDGIQCPLGNCEVANLVVRICS